MQDYFFTFGSGARANKYVRITAESRNNAREIMFREYGVKWAFSYDATQFNGQIEKYGLTQLEHLTDDSLRNNGE